MSKYGNKKVRALGVVFDSQAEADYAFYLTGLEKTGVIRNLVFKKDANKHLLLEKKRKPEWVIEKERKDPKASRVYKFLPSVNYISDFEYDDLRDCRHHVIDVKGVITPVYKIKKALMYWIHDIWVEEVKL